jgi:hypothetical protein
MAYICIYGLWRGVARGDKMTSRWFHEASWCDARSCKGWTSRGLWLVPGGRVPVDLGGRRPTPEANRDRSFWVRK